MMAMQLIPLVGSPGSKPALQPANRPLRHGLLHTWGIQGVYKGQWRSSGIASEVVAGAGRVQMLILGVHLGFPLRIHFPAMLFACRIIHSNFLGRASAP